MADQQFHHQIHDQHVQQNHPQQLQQKGQQAIENFKTFLQEKAPKTPQLLTIVTLLPIGAFLLFLAGLALTGSVIGLVIMTPLFIIFSPVIVPAIVVIGLSVLGFLTSSAFGLTGVSAISWIVNFLRSVRVGSGLEHGVHETGEYVGRKVKEMGQDVRDWGHEAGTGRAWE